MGHRIAVMRDGVLQQLDTPQTLYDRPANLFVAGFIGSPAMNFFTGELVSDSNSLYVQAPDLKLKVPDTRQSRLQTNRGQQIIFGVRPEYIHHRNEVREVTAGQTANAIVSVVEPLGSEVYAYLAAGGQEFIARMDATAKPLAGETIEVVFDTEHLHIFDKETEQALA
jgi:multiple sugar transport system ATP-binding protein